MCHLFSEQHLSLSHMLVAEELLVVTAQLFRYRPTFISFYARRTRTGHQTIQLHLWQGSGFPVSGLFFQRGLSWAIISLLYSTLVANLVDSSCRTQRRSMALTSSVWSLVKCPLLEKTGQKPVQNALLKRASLDFEHARASIELRRLFSKSSSTRSCTAHCIRPDTGVLLQAKHELRSSAVGSATWTV
jgi:hypothetical protein